MRGWLRPLNHADSSAKLRVSDLSDMALAALGTKNHAGGVHQLAAHQSMIENLVGINKEVCTPEILLRPHMHISEIVEVVKSRNLLSPAQNFTSDITRPVNKMKKFSSTRLDPVQVYEHCPRRPYLELTVPDDALAITKAEFKTLSRDQGWASVEDSCTWFEVALRRPGGRSDIAAVKIHYNTPANDQLERKSTCWDAHDAGTFVNFWLRQVRPGDVIELVPRAHFPCWVNIIQEACIEIEYQTLAISDHIPPIATLAISGTDRITYQPLQSEHRQIRVLVVEPGPAEADICARFECVTLTQPLDDKSGYHALSYYWAPPSETVPISIDACGQTSRVGISQTLHRALRRLRDSDECLRIWVDALCINQDDLEERAGQVAMMGSIYTHAQRVHVWLDNHILGIDAAFRIIRDMFNYQRRICGGGKDCQCSGTPHTLTAEVLEDISHRPKDEYYCFTREIFQEYHKRDLLDIEAYEAAGGQSEASFSHLCETFFHHPWFQRVWVIQEAILSPKTILYSPTQSILWEELLAVNDVITTDEYAERERWAIQGRNSMPAVWPALARAYDQYQLGGHPREQAMLPILDVFLRGLSSKATDPRDKLFAVLPFGRETFDAEKVPGPLRPNYTKPFEHVMADFVRWWILEYGALDILSCIHCQPTRAWRRTLCDQDHRLNSPLPAPSWTITDEGFGNHQLLHYNLRECFPAADLVNAESETPDKELIRSSAPLELPLRGRNLGMIKALGHPVKDMLFPINEEKSAGDSEITIRTVFDRLFDPVARTGAWLLQGINYADPESGDDEIKFESHQDAHYDYIPAAMLETLRPGPVGSLDYAWEESGDLPACIERCFFILSNGFFGLCPWTAKEGDVVVRLDGAKVPFVLRAVGTEEEGGKYQLVGECFVESVGSLGEGVGNVGEREVFVLV